MTISKISRYTNDGGNRNLEARGGELLEHFADLVDEMT